MSAIVDLRFEGPRARAARWSRWRRPLGAIGLLAWLTVSLAGCGAPTETPEAQVRAALAAAEEASQAKDLPRLKKMIAADYADAAGRDKKGIESILTYHFLRNSRIHLLVRIRDLSLAGDGQATVEALVATAGRPIPGLEALAGLKADLFWVDLGLVRRDGDWLVTRADWERARLEDLL